MTAGRRVTVILSDVHLSQAHPEDPADPMWMRYRRREHHPDGDFAALVDRLLADFHDAEIEVAFNGDLLDFDAPWVKPDATGKLTSTFEEFALDDRGCTEQAERILADHEIWFGAVAKLVAAGHRALFLSGNHDVELYWPGVRRAIRAFIRERAGVGEAEAEERVRFRAWFHRTPDRIYIEHGSQYDQMNGVRHAMLPVTKERDRIHPLFGKMAFKRTGSRMGYFNPYYEETFYMGLSGYLWHFLSHYAFSRKSIVWTWAHGGLSTVWEILRHRHREDRDAEGRELARAETGATDAEIDATHALRVRPAEETMLPILRELWLDRVGIAFGIAALSLGALYLSGWRAALIAAGAGVALFVVYELLTPKPDIRTYDSPPETVKALLDIHGARATCMGHTHRPWGVWDEGPDGPRFRGNSGSWSPAFHDADCTRPVLEGRPLLLLVSDGDALAGGLCWWRGGRLEPDVTARAWP